MLIKLRSYKCVITLNDNYVKLTKAQKRTGKKTLESYSNFIRNVYSIK